jgi:hypothetical protein
MAERSKTGLKKELVGVLERAVECERSIEGIRSFGSGQLGDPGNMVVRVRRSLRLACSTSGCSNPYIPIYFERS